MDTIRKFVLFLALAAQSVEAVAMKTALPLVAGIVALAAHALWHAAFPPAATSGWVAVAPSTGETLRAYAAGAVWLGASYAVSAAFTVYALSQFARSRRKAAAGAAGGLAGMGILYAAGCFALGCCGSPLLPFYLSVLGGRAAGLSGPLLFGLTMLSAGLGLALMKRRERCGCDATGDGGTDGRG